MHENGRRLQTRQYRTNTDGEEVMVHSAEVDYYSFLQAGFHVITNNDSVTIQVRVFFFGIRKQQRCEFVPVYAFRVPMCTAPAGERIRACWAAGYFFPR